MGVGLGAVCAGSPAWPNVPAVDRSLAQLQAAVPDLVEAPVVNEREEVEVTDRIGGPGGHRSHEQDRYNLLTTGEISERHLDRRAMARHVGEHRRQRLAHAGLASQVSDRDSSPRC